MAVNVLKPLMDRSLGLLERSLGNQTFIWRGTEYPCVIGTLRNGAIITVGGHEETIELTLIVRRSILPEPITVDQTVWTVDSTSITVDSDRLDPNPGRQIVKKGRPYRVLQISEAPTESHIALDLGSPKR